MTTFPRHGGNRGSSFWRGPRTDASGPRALPCAPGGTCEARHIIAINNDPEAPIFRVAHLGLVADLYPVMEALEKRFSR